MEESATLEMESMWSDLPADILERVFTFLPIASVCRFRTLSKSWNKYITSTPFRHAQASNVSPEEYLLLEAPRNKDGNWRVLDVARKRFLTFSDEFQRNHIQQQGLAPLGKCGRIYLAAAAGGLFCIEYMCYKTGVLAHFVCNLVLKTVKQLPHLAWWNTIDRVIVMSIDRVSMEYKILVVNIPDNNYINGHAYSEPHSILVYESKIGSWRSAPYKPLNPPVNYPSYQVWWDTLTIFRNQQYCIADKGSCGGIVSYDMETGEVSDLAGVDIPLAPTSHLVVSKDRLFCIIRVEHDTNDFPSLKIFEIIVAKKESILLTEMPQDLLLWILGGLSSWVILDCKIARSADSILICSIVGRCAAYSLSEKSWYQYPDDHNLLTAYCRAEMTPAELYGSSYCLSLCPP